MRLSNAALGLCLFVASLAAADAPYVGKWKVNPSKSDFGSTTITYTQLASGEMQATADGQSYKFKLDGKDYPDPYGETAAWTAVDGNTWQTVWKLNGKTLNTDSLKLTADGKTLTIESTGVKPNGEKMDDTMVFNRIHGSQGLAGQWKAKKFTSAAPGVFELAASAGGGLSLRFVDMGLTCDAKTDGKDYPCTGPTVGPGWAIAYPKAGKELDLVVKKDGKPLYRYTYSVSGDGKILTAAGGSTATNEKVKIVYDRQ